MVLRKLVLAGLVVAGGMGAARPAAAYWYGGSYPYDGYGYGYYPPRPVFAPPPVYAPYVYRPYVYEPPVAYSAPPARPVPRRVRAVRTAPRLAPPPGVCGAPGPITRAAVPPNPLLGPLVEPSLPQAAAPPPAAQPQPVPPPARNVYPPERDPQHID